MAMAEMGCYISTVEFSDGLAADEIKDVHRELVNAVRLGCSCRE